MRRAIAVTAMLIIAAFSGVILWEAFVAYLEALTVPSALELELICPTGASLKLVKGKLAVDLMAVIKNQALRDIEIEGGEYKLYVGCGWEYYPIVSGKMGRLYVKGASRQIVPISAEVSLFQLPKTLQSLIMKGKGSSLSIRIKLTLEVPAKLASIKLWTYKIRLSKTIYP